MNKKFFAYMSAAALTATAVYTVSVDDVKAETYSVEAVILETESEGFITVSIADYAMAFGTDSPLTSFINDQGATVYGIQLNDKIIGLLDYATQFDNTSMEDIYSGTDGLSLDNLRKITGYDDEGYPLLDGSEEQPDDEEANNEDNDFGVIDIY